MKISDWAKVAQRWPLAVGRRLLRIGATRNR